MDLPVLLLITLICSWAPLGSSYDRCLKNYPDVHPKKYAVFDRKSINITIQVSSRVTHQLATHAFYIFLTEVIGYEKVYITQEEDNFQVDEVIEKLNDFNNPIPQAMINLEVWVPPEFDTFKIEWIRECGSVAPPGRFGWFIPLDLDIPVINFYKNRWYADVNEVHWTILRESNAVGYFDISPNVMKGLERFTRTNFESKEYICNDPICTQSMYIPDRCRGNNVKCAVLLAPSYNETSFVITHINELKLLVKVLWLGDNLKPAINYLKQTYKGNNRSSILILNWTPSDVILHEKDYISVAFKHCELLNSHNSVGCKYEMHRLVKFAWSKIESFAKPLYEALRSFKFDETSYSLLLDLYEKNGASSLHDVSCEWMKQQQTTWTHWKKNTTSYIYIGGIFPISESSYAGRGIVHGAVMAKNAINLNATILPDYRLKLLATDGKCSADHVMKNFIDFIVDNVKDNLIGVLGPACSDTVEPLAGVSRHFRIMVISYSAEGASFSNREKYPYFFRTIGENKAYKHVYLELFKAFQWKRIAALTEDGQKYTEYISLMQDKLEKNGIKFISNKKFPRERETEAMSRYLEDLKNKHARIIIADVVDEVARNVMCEAYRLKMTAVQGYVWFLPMWLNATWYNTDYFNVGRNETVNCTTAEMIKAITGYFAMTHAYFAPDNDVMQENITVRQWRQTYENTTSVTSNYAGFAYDAIWTYALALDKLSRTDPEALSNIHSEETTNKLVRLVEQTDFHGVSGRIKFRGGPSRFSVINIMEWYDNKTHIIGQFYPNLTDHTPEILGGNLKLNRTAIKWFTENRQIPGDGTLPPSVCAIEKFAQLLNVSCQTSVIVLNVIIGGILFCVVIGFGVYMKRNFDRKVKDAEKFYMKTCGPRANLDKWEIPRVNVVINRKLGEGAFGTVYGGEANLADKGWVAIAVKTLKVGSTTEEKLDFLSEAEMMKRFNHKNIVQLLGVCTKEEPVYTVMEFMLYGDLKTFLLARRHLVNSTSEESEEISSKKLTSMALDVACGLSYLALEKYVHRDIASRNCLINAQRVVKLGDFGMTRPICIENDIYQFSRKGMLPVRWMAPESLALGVFTPASDIWSYGVLLYEIITFGSFPFQGSSNAQVLEIVKTGKTLDIPKGVKPQLECLIKSCWCIESRGRPPASEIVEFLANNPRLITPCLDVPLSSVQLEDTDQLELLPNQMRKSSGTSVKISPTSNGTSIESKLPTSIPARPKSPVPVYTPKYDMNLDTVNITLENCCCKEPLLGRSSTSLKNLGKYVNVQHNRMDSGCQDEDEEYVAHSPPNGLTKL